MSLTDFCILHKIRIVECNVVDANPHNPEWRDATHYRIVMRHGQRKMSTHFSQGYAHIREPKTPFVLSSLISEAESVQHYETFEEWARDMDQSTDSRQAELSFKACRTQASQLRRFLGPDLFKELLSMPAAERESETSQHQEIF